METNILEDIISKFDIDKFIQFFRNKNRSFTPKREKLDQYDDENFKEGLKLGEINFTDEGQNFIVCAFKSSYSLTERSGKKAQYEKAKRILKNLGFDAGVFVFYDRNSNFRFSLIYANYLGKKRDWSTFRRFTYFISSDYTNKTFLQRIGLGDFSSLEKIKDAFSVEKVTKDFYKDIANWYFWAVRNSKFPKDAEAEENGRNIAVIRLITRLIFIWFMRERGLMPKDLFDKEKIKDYLKDPGSGESTYYKAILQNLFFATLSTKQEERKFGSEKRYNKGWNEDYGNQYVFRYHELFKNPEDLKKYFAGIPFLNGGLFECLDDKRNGILIDGFSRTKKNQPIVPNFLFFSDEENADLNTEYGTKKKKYKVQGLINTLSSYNFTIDENEPDDAEVALDPELLGKVFENLLASFNPETSSTARKATGSYYTPREIVDYMVIQSLKEYLKTHLEEIDKLDEKIDQLFKNQEPENPFADNASKKIVDLIDNLRIVDPAVGSGAFPMGILNKLVFILGKLDPDNKLWKEAQIYAVKNNITDPVLRRNYLEQINEQFANKNFDYGRKLYLIQKCIYGVDIQQIAVEIAKLRFFIALLVDEKIDKSQENWGIEPLPNLDFKIMQGNSLISEFMGINFDDDNIGKDKGQIFSNHQEAEGLIDEFQQKKNEFQNEPDRNIKEKLKKEIDDLMIQIFKTKLKKQKADYFSKIKRIEEKYANLPNKEEADRLIAKEKKALSNKEGFDLEKFESQLREFSGKSKTKPFFAWRLYFAEVFQGDNPGFDIVIANPPYVEHKKLKGVSNLLKGRFRAYSGTADLYVYFYEVALNILRKKGILSFISSNKFIRTKYGVNLRAVLAEYKINNIVDFTKVHIFDALVASCILIVSKDNPIDNIIVSFVDNAFIGDLTGFIERNHILVSSMTLKSDIWHLEDQAKLKIKQKIEYKIIKLGEIEGVKIFRGVTTGFNLAFVIDKKIKNNLITQDLKSKDIIKPLLQGRNIGKWVYLRDNKFLIFTRRGININKYKGVKNYLAGFKKELEPGKGRKPGQYKWFEIQDNTAYYPEFEKEKIVWGLTANKWAFAFDNESNFLPSNGYILTSSKIQVKYLLALLNSKLMKFYFSFIGIMTAGGAFTLKHETINNFPIKTSSEEKQNSIIAFVEKILLVIKSDDYLNNPRKQAKVIKLEDQINQFVYKLYDLTPEEIKIVEGEV